MTKAKTKKRPQGAKHQVRRKTKKKAGRSTGKLKKMLWAVFLCAFLAVAGFVIYCGLTLPDIDVALNKTRLPSTTLIADNGNEIMTFGNTFSRVIYLDDLPTYVPAAIVAVEDKRFYGHFGFDVIGLVRAGITNIFKKRYAQGASTITQQVAKNLFLTPQKNLKRKVQELWLALWLEHKFSKDQILMLYLNRVYLGSGTYGIEAAANKYFGKSSSDLSLKEAAVIAGMLKAPSRYNPLYSPKNATERAEIVLKIMLGNGLIDEAQYNAALKEPLHDAKSFKVEGARHFADMVFAEVNDYIGERDQDIYVSTTLDQDLQQKAETVLQNMVRANAQNNVTEGALVILDYDGAIKALVGGVNYQKNQFNHAVQALRQPGSAFKTFVYITALQHSFEPEDIISDAPVKIGRWQPQNVNQKYYGDVTLDFAFSHSLNLATVNLSRQFNLNDVIKNAKKMGVTTDLKKIPSLVLGTSEVKVIDMAAAYLSIANGGYSAWPYAINEIYLKNGRQLYRRLHEENGRVLDEKTVGKITKMLEDVILTGTGKNAALKGFAAGKTGTSQNFRDAWFVGFTKEYVMAVWVGNDDNSAMKNITGGSLPAKIFAQIFSDSSSK